MSRTYSISFTDVAVSALQDLFEVLCGSGKWFILEELVIGQRSDFGDAEAEGLMVLIRRASAGYTTGSGGSAGTAVKHTSLDVAFSGTAKVNNTTQATGTLTTLRDCPFNVQGECEYFPTSGKVAYAFNAGEALVVSISSAPVDALTMSGTVVITEYDA